MSHSIVNNSANLGFGIYVHWPFCESKCPYCDFNSHVRKSAPDQKKYLSAFNAELTYFAQYSSTKVVTSIFFGGGTPSLMEPATVAGILEIIRNNWSLSEDLEITLEANPSSVEANRFKAFQSVGINRVSLGIQSLDDTHLKKLGRLHNVTDAINAIETARNNFENVSIDLIYARQDQLIKDWQIELKRALNFETNHLSLYQLTIENNTPYFTLHQSGKLKVPDSDECADFYLATQEICNEFQMPAYEISNHAKFNSECKHNLNYWRYGDYIGVGPGAHGRLTINSQRFATLIEKHPETWLKCVESDSHGVINFDQLSDIDCGNEYLIMALRTTEGIDLNRFEQLSGQQLNSEKLDYFFDNGLLIKSKDQHIKPTEKAFLLVNSIVAELAI